MLEVKNLYAGYNGVDIVKNISLSARRGEILAVIGPNGCGKTTLLKTLARLLDFRGSISLDDKEIGSLSRKNLAKKTALLAQNSGVYFPFTVYDTAALGRYPHSASFLGSLSPKEIDFIRQVLEQLELWEVRDRLTSELSGGQVQRVFLARTLVQDPDLVLLDEPTNHLDLKHQVELLDYLSRWAREKDRAVVAVLHDLNLARRFADRIALMSGGVLVAEGSAESVLSGEALTRAFGLDIRAFMLESLEKWRAGGTGAPA